MSMLIIWKSMLYEVGVRLLIIWKCMTRCTTVSWLRAGGAERGSVCLWGEGLRRRLTGVHSFASDQRFFSTVLQFSAGDSSGGGSYRSVDERKIAVPSVPCWSRS